MYRPDEGLEFFGEKDVRAPDQLLDEHVQVKAPLFDELLILVHLSLARYRWDVKARISLKKYASQEIEFSVPPPYLKWSTRIDADHEILNMVAFVCLLWIAYAELLSEFVRAVLHVYLQFDLCVLIEAQQFAGVRAWIHAPQLGGACLRQTSRRGELVVTRQAAHPFEYRLVSGLHLVAIQILMP